MPERHNKPIYITGQQLGLLGGPLYTIYKIAGTIYNAKKSNGKAVFWLEGNDADFGEINHFYFLPQGNQGLKKYTWNIDSMGRSVGIIEVDSHLQKILDEFLTEISQLRYATEIGDLLAEIYKPGRTLLEAMQFLMSVLFKKYEIELFNPMNLHFLKFIKPILLQEAHAAEDDNQMDLFISRNGLRRAVFKKNGGFYTRDGEKLFLEKEILLPNVNTRSICQDAYFKPKAYIAGPGEQFYLSKLGDRYARHGISPAAIIPRMSVLLLRPQDRKTMNALNLSNIDVLRMADAADITRYVIDKFSPYNWLDGKKKADLLTNEFLKKLTENGIASKDLHFQVRKLIKNELGQLRKSAKEQTRPQLEMGEQLAAWVFPAGKKQERILNAFQIMAEMGIEPFIDFIVNNYDRSTSILELNYD